MNDDFGPFFSTRTSIGIHDEHKALCVIGFHLCGTNAESLIFENARRIGFSHPDHVRNRNTAPELHLVRGKSNNCCNENDTCNNAGDNLRLVRTLLFRRLKVIPTLGGFFAFDARHLHRAAIAPINRRLPVPWIDQTLAVIIRAVKAGQVDADHFCSLLVERTHRLIFLDFALHLLSL